MEINRIYIACYKGDFWQTKACVASIRYWYPFIDIFLIVDSSGGNFSTREVEKFFNVKKLSLERENFGWGFSKLEPILLPNRERFLYLDSDTIFIGPVLDSLSLSEAEFIVSPEINEDPNNQHTKRNYYNFKLLSQFDPQFVYPGYLFNTGQFVGTSGIFKREDFSTIINFSKEVPELFRKDVFAYTDQGLLNYFLIKQSQLNKIILDKVEFMIWSGDVIQLKQLKFKCIENKTGYQRIIHYAGRGKKPIRLLDRGDIYLFFLNKYFNNVPNGKLKLLKLIIQLELKWIKLNLWKKSKSLRNLNDT